MTSRPNRFATILRIAVASVLVVELLLVARGVLTGTRYRNAPGSPIVAGFVVALVIAGAIAILLNVRRPKSRTIQFLVVGVALALTVRFHLAAYLHRVKAPGPPRLAFIESPKLFTFLQDLSSAQEQYRLRSGRYSESMDSLRAWIEQPPQSIVKLSVNHDLGWSGQASLDGKTCSIWVRDSALRSKASQPEGHPMCGTPERRLEWQRVPTVVAQVPLQLRVFRDADIAGTWLQHRADARRTGATSGLTTGDSTTGYSWNARVSGPLRASVAIAGNQVFVGAHGNGEFVALTLDSGKLGFRLRAPNWVHHEPAVSNELVIVGFGNNEWVRTYTGGTGPSGVVAYDRRTGFERWRLNTVASVMGAPVISDSVVAVSTGGEGAVGMRLRDGTRLWQSAVRGRSPMTNPLLVNNLMIFGMEFETVCAIDVHTGAQRYCVRLVDSCLARWQGSGVNSRRCWGAGHTSPALAGDVVLQVLEFDKVNPIELVMARVKKILGFPPPAWPPTRVPDRSSGETILVAFDWRDGRIRWRTSLGKGSLFPPGHIAGTPTVVDSVAYIPAATNGHVVAVNTRTGRVLWSAPVRSSRGSVSVIRGSVFAATNDTTFVVLNAANGSVTCRQRLPARADRAGLTISGETGILTLGNGTVMARPIADWVACQT